MANPAPGLRLGPYELVSPIGTGGMGEVWKARDTRLDRDVAVKISPAQFSERFEREAHAVAALNHPNICTLHDVGPNYLVMEYVDGAPVSHVDTTRKLLDLAVQIADGLAAAHNAGVLHRDLKPANILVTRDGRAKILDFGLAKIMAPAQDDPTLAMNSTQPGVILGTIAYMSPEQGRCAPLDSRSDQFSFGLVLYEMATGKRPFERSTPPEMLTAIIREDPAPLPATVPAPLRWIIERLLAKDPEDRYASTKDLYHELRAVREHLSQISTTTATSPAAPPAKPRSLKPLLAAAAGVLAGSAAVFFLIPPAQSDLSSYRITPISREEATESSPEWSPDGKSIAYSAMIHGIDQIFTRAIGVSEPAQLTHAKQDCILPFWSPDGASIYFRSGSDLWAVATSGGTPQLLFKNSGNAAIHPDGKTFAIARDRKLWIGPVGQQREYSQQPFPAQAAIGGIRFSPDGSRLAVFAHPWESLSEFAWWILPYPAGSPRKIRARDAAELRNWFPDNRRLISARFDKTGMYSMFTLDTATGTEHTIYRSADVLAAPSVSSDGKRLVYQAGPARWDLMEISLSDGAVSPMLDRGGLSIGLDWAPSGTHYLFGSNAEGTFAIEDRSLTENFSRVMLLASSEYFPSPVTFLTDMRWAPDGRRFAFRANSQTGSHIWLLNLSGGRPVALDPSSQESQGASWSPDGLWMSYYRSKDGKMQLAKIGTGAGAAPVILATAGAPAGSQTRWSPNGDWILYRDTTGLALISPDGTQQRPLSRRRFSVYGFSKRGDSIYGVFRNIDQYGPEWQLFSVDVNTGAETFLAPLNMPAATNGISGFSLHPDGKHFAISVGQFPYDIWMMEGFDQQKSWIDRLLRR